MCRKGRLVNIGERLHLTWCHAVAGSAIGQYMSGQFDLMMIGLYYWTVPCDCWLVLHPAKTKAQPRERTSAPGMSWHVQHICNTLHHRQALMH